MSGVRVEIWILSADYALDQPSIVLSLFIGLADESVQRHQRFFKMYECTKLALKVTMYERHKIDYMNFFHIADLYHECTNWLYV